MLVLLGGIASLSWTEEKNKESLFYNEPEL